MRGAMDQSDGLQVCKFLFVTRLMLNDRLKRACALLRLSRWLFKIGHLTVVQRIFCILFLWYSRIYSRLLAGTYAGFTGWFRSYWSWVLLMESELQSSSQEMRDSDSGESYAQAFCLLLPPFPLLKSSPQRPCQTRHFHVAPRQRKTPERASSTRLSLTPTSVLAYFQSPDDFPLYF